MSQTLLRWAKKGAIAYAAYFVAFTLAAGAATGAGVLVLAFTSGQQVPSTVAFLGVFFALAWSALRLGQRMYRGLQPPT